MDDETRKAIRDLIARLERGGFPVRQHASQHQAGGIDRLPGGASLTVRDIDLTPSIANVDTLEFTNGSVTDIGGGVARVTVGGGANHALLDASVHTDTALDTVTAGALVVGGAAAWEKLPKPAPTEIANTTPATHSTANWGSQAGNARKVLLYNSATGVLEWANLTAIDILTPAQVLTFTATPAGGISGSGLVASSGTDIPAFAMTYQGTCTAATIDILSHTYGGGRSPEVAGGDYPATVLTPFASLSGPAINRGQAVGESVTYRITATVDGQTKTKDVTVTYLNYRYWGTDSNAAIDTDAEIDTFAGTDNAEISSSRVKTFTVTAAGGEYIYYIIRTALGTPTFTVGGFEGGFSKVGSAVVHTNSRSFSETYDVWRSDTAGLGSTTVVVT